MPNTDSKYDYLRTINGVKLTPREIDVIACLLSGRGVKAIAQFLSIEEKTVETHKYNVMRKMNTNFKEGIIEFTEKSDKIMALKDHYFGLLKNVMFEKYLQKINNLKRNANISCVIIHEADIKNKKFSNQLAESFKFLGIETHKIEKQVHELFSQSGKLPDTEYIIYLPSKSLLEKLKANSYQIHNEINDQATQLAQNKRKLFILVQDDEFNLDIPVKVKGGSFISYNKQDDYNVLICNIFQALFSDVGIDRISAEFIKQYKTISDSSIFAQIEPRDDVSTQYNYPLFDPTSPISSESKKKLLIRSDLAIPNEATLIYRDRLMSQIENLLNSDEAIQTIALVGVGGAGKTTVARQYARIQEEPIVWEVNAETQENLMSSFENLAYALSETENEKRMLRGYQETMNPKDKEDKVILFVKNKLKSQGKWFLIYDDVEKFTDIQKYFPYNADTWGRGKILITTRDSNIEYNTHIKSAIVVGELGPLDRVTLFNNIINTGDIPQYDDYQAKQIESFINNIPPFPLDVSIAAYYLKTTNLPYQNYIAYLCDYDKDLDAMQQDIIREATQYVRTRYSIITLSIDCFLKTNSEFVELLLLISLVDPQNISKDILSSFKSEVVVDSFIYHLRKYSLTVCSPIDKPHTTPYLTIHRCTQEISLNYLSKKLNLPEDPSILRKIAQMLENYASKIFDTVDFDKIKNLKSHCEALLSRECIFLKIGDIKAVIEGILGTIHFYLGNYKNSRLLLENSFEKIKRSLIIERDREAKLLVYLGMVNRKLGEYSKAKEFIDQSLIIYEKDFPHMHLEFAWVLGNLALVYRHLGNYEKAQLLFEDSLKVYFDHFGQYNIGYAWVLANLGHVHRNLGNFKKAQEFLGESLVIYKKNLPENHTEIAWVLVQLGDIYRNLGKYTEAENLIKQGFQMYEEQFGKDHIEAAWVIAYLGRIYREVENHEKSMNMIKENHDFQEESQINKHEGSVSSSGVLQAYLEENHHHKAKELLEESLLAFEKQFGINHVSTARIMVYLAEFYKDAGNYQQAEALISRS